MKIGVRDVEANPYRKISTYPIDAAKVEALKTSIRETDFWDNVLVRRKPGAAGKYELAYGHHRLTALRELGIKEIDIPVKDLDDATMLRIMAGENMDIYKSDPKVINETVQVAKEFIDAELAKYETWGELAKKAGVFTSLLCSMSKESKGQYPPKWYFNQAKAQGAGRNIICSFLGGNWKEHMVRNALLFLHDDTIDRKAIEKFPTMEQAKDFRKALKRYEIPIEEQSAVADAIIQEKQSSKREIPNAVKAYVEEKVKGKVGAEFGGLCKVDPEMEELNKQIKGISSLADKLGFEIDKTAHALDGLSVEQLYGPETLYLITSVSLLLKTIKRFSEKYNLDFYKE